MYIRDVFYLYLVGMMSIVHLKVAAAFVNMKTMRMY